MGLEFDYFRLNRCKIESEMTKNHTVVFVEQDTKRILGFAPEGLTPMFPAGTRYDTKTPFDVIEMENWLKKYRAQQKFDAETKAYRQIMREKPMRDSIRSAILARNNQVNPLNRDLNNALITFMDAEYDRIMAQLANPDVFGVAEAYEETKSGEDLAIEAPIFRGAR